MSIHHGQYVMIRSCRQAVNSSHFHCKSRHDARRLELELFGSIDCVHICIAHIVRSIPDNYHGFRRVSYKSVRYKSEDGDLSCDEYQLHYVWANRDALWLPQRGIIVVFALHVSRHCPILISSSIYMFLAREPYVLDPAQSQKLIIIYHLQICLSAQKRNMFDIVDSPFKFDSSREDHHFFLLDNFCRLYEIGGSYKRLCVKLDQQWQRGFHKEPMTELAKRSRTNTWDRVPGMLLLYWVSSYSNSITQDVT